MAPSKWLPACVQGGAPGYIIPPSSLPLLRPTHPVPTCPAWCGGAGAVPSEQQTQKLGPVSLQGICVGRASPEGHTGTTYDTAVCPGPSHHCRHTHSSRTPGWGPDRNGSFTPAAQPAPLQDVAIGVSSFQLVLSELTMSGASWTLSLPLLGAAVATGSP